MTPRQSAKVCLPATSCPCSRGATLSMAADWGDGDGWSNGPLPGLRGSRLQRHHQDVDRGGTQPTSLGYGGTRRRLVETWPDAAPPHGRKRGKEHSTRQ